MNGPAPKHVNFADFISPTEDLIEEARRGRNRHPPPGEHAGEQRIIAMSRAERLGEPLPLTRQPRRPAPAGHRGFDAEKAFKGV